MSHSQTSLITLVIKTYGLALEEDRVEAMLITWFQTYDSTWIAKAIVESLYRGRYKLISVENILKDWQRIGKPRYNFTPEYEREIFQNIPSIVDSGDWESLSAASAEKGVASESIDAASVESVGTESYYIFMPVDRSVASGTQNLNPEESAPFQYHHNSIAIADAPTPQAKSVSAATAPVVTPARMVMAANYSTSRAIPSGSLQGETQFRARTEPARQAVRPAKRRLFNTLKAIVDPNNHYDATAEESVVLLTQSFGQM
ncbi:hypothetical protein [Chamaesiphon sp. VAR_69_metabat_338]|uniref:hypothetical protein n=1 Tax=Chamaesiphon sp. VAR_69_metabat_338 TaxID=2964704 RepID=UPI00286DB94A|nr:hypothetical protein [Chamaesiphon sp. VAR_69_metabat_338]